MPRAGRDLELLVARLEAAAAAYPVDVVSPDRIPGRDSQLSLETVST